MGWAMAGRGIATLTQVVDAVGGRFASPTEEAIVVHHVAIDSRSVLEGSLFVALPGEYTDGHLFLADAAARGAVAAIVSREVEGAGIPLVVVESSLGALQALAAWYVREYLASTVRIGVTGSNGKTTTKELIASAIRSSAECFASEGNLNSETGLPLSIFTTPPGVPYAIYEMAMSAPGEMEALAEIVRPQIACITNIGSAHIEFLGSKRAIALEKRMIAARFTGTETLVVPEDDEFTSLLSETVDGVVRLHGPKSQGLVIDAKREHDAVWIEGKEIEPLRLPLPGPYNGRNALAAIAVARELGLADRVTIPALAAVQLPGGRSDLFYDTAGNCILNDSYNANPESMVAFIATVAGLRDAVRTGLVLVLGDMMELGDHAVEEHRRVLAAACEAYPGLVVLVGTRFAAVYRDHYAALCAGIPVERVDTVDDARDRLAGYDLTARVIGVKGSHSLALEKVLSLFERREVARGA